MITVHSRRAALLVCVDLLPQGRREVAHANELIPPQSPTYRAWTLAVLDGMFPRRRWVGGARRATSLSPKTAPISLRCKNSRRKVGYPHPPPSSFRSSPVQTPVTDASLSDPTVVADYRGLAAPI